MKEETSTIMICAKCGAKNRVVSGVDKLAVCGRCKNALNAVLNDPIIVTDANFAGTVESSTLPVLLDMWAAWCGPCRMIAPTIAALAKELAGKVLVGKMDVDANPQTASRFRVQSIPTLLILKEGREADRIVGVQSKEAILRRLARFT